MNKAYQKDVFRSIAKGWKRFLSIMVITALGVAMMTGLYAACMDLFLTADRFYDDQRLFDVRVVSTLGLTDADVQALAAIDGVQAAEGAYSETVYTYTDGTRKSVEMAVLSPSGLNRPYLLEGRMPERQGEMAVIQKYLDASGKAIGDQLTIEEDIAQTVTGNSAPVSKDDGKSNNADAHDLEIELQLDAEPEEPTFLNTTYTITGVVIDPMDIQSVNTSANTFRAAADTDYTFFITDQDAQYDVFSTAYLVMNGTQGLEAFSDEYEGAVLDVTRTIEQRIKVQREQARYGSVLMQARQKIQDAQATMDEKFAEADQEFADAWKDIEDARQELIDGEATLSAEQQDAERKIADARARLRRGANELNDARQQLKDGEVQLQQGEAELEQNAQQIGQGMQQLADERKQYEEQMAFAQQQLEEAQVELDASRAQLLPAVEQLKAAYGPVWPQNEWDALVNAAAELAAGGADDDAIAQGTASQIAALTAVLPGPADDVLRTALGMGRINGAQQALDAKKDAFKQQKQDALKQLEDAEAQLHSAQTQLVQARLTLEEKRSELESGKVKLDNGRAEIAEGIATLNKEEADAKQKLADAWQELADGKRELADGETELKAQEQDYAEQKQQAQQKLADAYDELSEISMATWYIQDRTSLNSYSSLNSDLSSIAALGKVFPVIFLLVAVLMSLTAMTRMVEEERGLIGIYKAMGFTNAAIYSKYLLFAFLACLFGGVLGDAIGFVMIPQFVSVIMQDLYTLPGFFLSFDLAYGVGGVLLFMVSIIGSTLLACRSELSQMPAALMRPKAPRAGTRVFLEHIPAIWNRLGFLKKVTFRNLFRYKKRLFMTVGGIMGCTALVLCGFAIKDSVADLAPKQYQKVYQYDLMTVFKQEDNSRLIGQMGEDTSIESLLNLRIESVTAMNLDKKGEKMQMLAIPDGSPLSEYIRLENLNGKPVMPENSGVMITQNAATILGLSLGDRITLQNIDLVQRDVAISGIVKNYLGNSVYMTQQVYEAMFGQYLPNGVLAQLADTVADHGAYAKKLLDNDSVLSSVSTRALQADFGFDLMDAVVLLITAMAGGLAFVVLFTLSSTNISERERELATIKVLGFYDQEVHQYVNRETLILSTIGILLGLPVGRVVSGFLTMALQMPSIHFAVVVSPASYAISAAITLAFTLLVNWMTNRTLNHINMVEALKSIE